MTNKTTSRATKMVLASLLAASIALPSAASADSISKSSNAAVTIAETIAADQAIKYEVFKPGTKDPQPAISGHIEAQGTLNKGTANLIIPAKSAPMIAGLQVKQGENYENAKEVKNADGTITYSFPMTVSTVYPAKILVNIPGQAKPHVYDFDFKAEAAKQDAVTAVNVPVKVFKDGTSEESMMKNYMSSTASVKKMDGTNEVTISFPKGHYIQSVKVEGKEVPVATDDKSTGARTYTFKVADLKKVVNAQLHVIVDEAGVKYDANHQVQLGFDGAAPSQKPVTPAPSVNPFTDIDKDGNKAAILALYEKGIVKGADKFNPRNNITRSQFALMVARALDLKPTKSAGFKDLDGIKDQERLDAINALAEANIIKSGDKFNPNGTLTRQQGALMLYRAVNHAAGMEINMGDTSLKYYADGSVVTDPEAKKAFALLHAGEIMTGSKAADGKTYIKAGSPLQRTQMAKILYGSLQHMNK